MTIRQATVSARPAGLSVGQDRDALGAIQAPDCAVAVWARDMPDQVRDWLAGVAPAHLPSARVIIPPDAVANTLGRLFDLSGLPAGTARDWLQGDIVSLAQTFARLMRAKVLRLRLDVVTTNACRRFHTDALTARLVCTYRGTGTQFGLSQGGADPVPVFGAKTGAPAVMRGTRWPARPDAGLLHRSPPIEGTGETRLVLVLDPVFDPDDEA